MINRFVALAVLTLFILPSAFSKTNTQAQLTGEVLSHQQFLKLYEADQKKYAMLLRKAAVELSYRDGLSYAESAPPIKILQSRLPANSESEAGVIDGNSQSGAASANIYNYFKRISMVFAPILPGVTTALWIMPSIIPYIFPDHSVPLPPAPPRGEVRDPSRGAMLGPAVPRAKPPEVVPSAVVDVPVSIAESVTVSADLTALRTAVSMDVSLASSDNSCVRCIYGGFVISNKDRCDAVKNDSQMTEQLGPLNLKPPMKVSDFKCREAGLTVMCNPVLFGTKGGAPICIAPSKTATKDCADSAGTDAESIAATVDLLKRNPDAFKKYSENLVKICNYDSLCYSETRKEDIRLTCGTLHAHFDKFKENMRVASTAPVVAPPAASGDGTRVGDSVGDGISVGQ